MGISACKPVNRFCDADNSYCDYIKTRLIFSVEPGVYLQGEFGVRIEDLVLIIEDGCQVLNNVTKDLTIIK